MFRTGSSWFTSLSMRTQCTKRRYARNMDNTLPTLKLVVAACNNWGIGKDGQLPWRLKKDMEFFKKTTMQTQDPDKKNVVVMGRKTWFSIPEKFRPLANRVNIILTNTMSNSPTGAYLAKSLNEAVAMVTGNGVLADKVEGVFIIGGSSVYEAAMESDLPCRIYLTRVLADFDCDTFLPKIDQTTFTKINDCDGVPKEQITENGIDFVFEVYDKPQNKVHHRSMTECVDNVVCIQSKEPLSPAWKWGTNWDFM
uniref:dihydrofolate reductase n=1 Tax=Crassostrea virginica TaxID=6565 RepID=A0A8B8BZW2_CRAVI|nr:dihydrofolate reductase-like [Crassostrea virginica]